MVAGAAATAPMLGEAAMAQAGSNEADALFRAGKFEQAGRAYEKILKKDPTNLHATRQRGYVGLVANQFPDAEKYLKMAVELAPADKQANQFLADCYIRQDKFSLAVPRAQAAGNEIDAKWFAAVSGKPYQIHGDSARLKWKQMDPYPLVEASVNGGPLKRFTFYTGTGPLSVSASVAKEVGLRAVTKHKLDFLKGVIWRYLGVLESFKLGGIELRNIPVSWSEWESGGDVDTEHDGMIGTWVLYHLLTTFDYAGQSLILRRRTPETARKARADAERAGAKPLPLWLAREHMCHSRGSFAGSGPRVMAVNFGGTGEIAAGVHGETAKQLRIPIDYDRPVETAAHSHPVVIYPCYPKEVRLGNAVAKDFYCYMNPKRSLTPYGFDVPAHISHSFWKPYNITLDFTDMNLYIARGKAT
ncbi:aspartyl protease family protein [Actinomadura sp. 6N118]|uniref:aspartyl protease family protein n=1 Tax=Actinomadura sp. 6N118 TaxID=3375151 RepID=UPI0037A24264